MFELVSGGELSNAENKTISHRGFSDLILKTRKS